MKGVNRRNCAFKKGKYLSLQKGTRGHKSRYHKPIISQNYFVISELTKGCTREHSCYFSKLFICISLLVKNSYNLVKIQCSGMDSVFKFELVMSSDS